MGKNLTSLFSYLLTHSKIRWLKRIRLLCNIFFRNLFSNEFFWPVDPQNNHCPQNQQQQNTLNYTSDVETQLGCLSFKHFFNLMTSTASFSLPMLFKASVLLWTAYHLGWPLCPFLHPHTLLVPLIGQVHHFCSLRSFTHSSLAAFESMSLNLEEPSDQCVSGYPLTSKRNKTP